MYMNAITYKKKITEQRLSGQFLILSVLSVVALLFAACGGTSDASSTVTSTSGKTTTSTAKGASAATSSFTAYRDCLAKHGLTLPGFSGRRAGFAGSSGFRRFRSGSSGTGVGGFPRGASGTGGFFSSNPKYKAALSACASLRPKGGFRGFPGGGGFSSSVQNKAFQDCLQVNGLSLSDLRPASGKRPAISAADRKIIGECLSLVHKSSSSTATTVKGS